VEVVVLSPVIFLFALAMVGLALYAQNVSQVQDAASDAARMASQQGSSGAALSYANSAASQDMHGTCNSSARDAPSVELPSTAGVTNQYGAAVTLLEASVTCKISELGFEYTITESSYAPLDTFGGGQQ
jgi:Flp pilus assembly protein TadG